MRRGDGIFEEHVPFSFGELFRAAIRFDGASIKTILRGVKRTDWHMSIADASAIAENRFDVEGGLKVHKRLATDRPDLVEVPPPQTLFHDKQADR